MAELTYAQVSKLLKYDPETGKLFWLPRPREMFPSERTWKIWNTRYAGKEAITAKDGLGYRIGRLLGKNVRAHRVAWLLHTGEWPRGNIDHINGDGEDNRFSNMRDGSQSQNIRNACRRSDNTSGFGGVYWAKQIRKWVAQVQLDGRTTHIGTFDDFNDAVTARKAVNMKYGYTERHGRPER